VRLLGRLEAADPLVHVPAERADHADVVVVAHLPVGDDVEARLLLVGDRDRGRVLVGLGVVDVLEGDAHVAAVELLVVPVRARVGAHHRGRQDGVDDLPLRHPLLLSCCRGASALRGFPARGDV